MKKLKQEYMGTEDILRRHDYHRDSRSVFGTRFTVEDEGSSPGWSWGLLALVVICAIIIWKTVYP